MQGEGANNCNICIHCQSKELINIKYEKNKQFTQSVRCDAAPSIKLTLHHVSVCGLFMARLKEAF